MGFEQRPGGALTTKDPSLAKKGKNHQVKATEKSFGWKKREHGGNKKEEERLGRAFLWRKPQALPTKRNGRRWAWGRKNVEETRIQTQGAPLCPLGISCNNIPHFFVGKVKYSQQGPAVLAIFYGEEEMENQGLFLIPVICNPELSICFNPALLIDQLTDWLKPFKWGW